MTHRFQSWLLAFLANLSPKLRIVKPAANCLLAEGRRQVFDQQHRHLLWQALLLDEVWKQLLQGIVDSAALCSVSSYVHQLDDMYLCPWSCLEVICS